MKECQDWVDLVNTLAALYSCSESLKNYHEILSQASEVPSKDNEAKKSGILSVDNKSNNNTDLTDKDHTPLNTHTFEDDFIKITSHVTDTPAPSTNHTTSTAPHSDGTDKTKNNQPQTAEHTDINDDKTTKQKAEEGVCVDWRKSLSCHPLHIVSLCV